MINLDKTKIQTNDNFFNLVSEIKYNFFNLTYDETINKIDTSVKTLDNIF